MYYIYFKILNKIYSDREMRELITQIYLYTNFMYANLFILNALCIYFENLKICKFTNIILI